ncbi:hypothetical protein ABZ912_49950 [Nonomuraea angiospora]
MIPQLGLVGLAIATALIALSGVYLFSTNQTRRTRAWRLLRLLLRR